MRRLPPCANDARLPRVCQRVLSRPTQGACAPNRRQIDRSPDASHHHHRSACRRRSEPGRRASLWVLLARPSAAVNTTAGDEHSRRSKRGRSWLQLLSIHSRPRWGHRGGQHRRFHVNPRVPGLGMRIPPSARPSLAAASNGLPCRHGPSPPHLPDAPPLFAQCGHIIMIRPHRPVARTLPARPRAASSMASRRRAAACRGVSVTNVPALPGPRCLIEAVVASAWPGVARAARSAFLEEKSIPSQGDRLPARRSVPAPSGNAHHSHHAQ